MNIITNIIYEIEQPIITNTFKEFFSISDHLPYVYESLSTIQKYNLELIIRLFYPFIMKYHQKNIKKEPLL